MHPQSPQLTIGGTVLKESDDLDRVSDPMLSPVPKSGYFLDYLNFGALFGIFLWSMC